LHVVITLHITIWRFRLGFVHAWYGMVEGLPVYLLEAEKPSAFFWRGQFY
jgi:hypothetical protein